MVTSQKRVHLKAMDSVYKIKTWWREKDDFQKSILKQQALMSL